MNCLDYVLNVNAVLAFFMLIIIWCETHCLHTHLKVVFYIYILNCLILISSQIIFPQMFYLDKKIKYFNASLLPQLSLFTPDHWWHRAQVPSTLLQDWHLYPWDGCSRALCEEWPPLCFCSRATWSPTSSLWYQVTYKANSGFFSSLPLCQAFHSQASQLKWTNQTV